MRICYPAAEVAPFSKTGGLADVSGDLPRQLARMGHDVRVFTPLYASIDRERHGISPYEAVRDVDVDLGGRGYRFSLWSGGDGAGHRVFFVDCPELYGRGEIYTSDPDEPRRFGMLCRAVFESCQRMRWAPEIMHCHDWHTGLIPLMRRTVYEWDTTMFGNCRTLLTIHNLGYQGVFGADAIDAVGMGGWRDRFDRGDLDHGRINYLRTGLLYADALTTVSPTYAAEIQTDAYGMGLAPLLRARAGALVGILNGVDYGEWDPTSDPHLPHHYSRDDMDGKARTRAHLLNELRMDAVGDAPLVGVISRLVPQKGFDLTFPVLPELLRRGRIGLVVLGRGDPRYHEFFVGLQRSHPGRVVFYEGYNPPLAHVIEAASDIFLMPSRYEPCGLNQLFSMRYGTIPVVRRTGGLADSVVQYDPRTERGTGFLFDHFSADGLRWALDAALATFDDRPRWNRLVANAMAVDFSWRRQAERYVEIYHALTGA